jgi:sulfur relay (sulfurtransferase) DsrC/TusE family protein
MSLAKKRRLADYVLDGTMKHTELVRLVRRLFKEFRAAS